MQHRRARVRIFRRWRRSAPCAHPIALVIASRPRYHSLQMSESTPQPDPEPDPPPPETREQFVQRVIQIVKDRFPLVKIARAGESFSLRVNESVASLENLYRMAQLQPETLQHHVERWA